MNWKSLLCDERIRKVEKNPNSRDLRTEFEKDYHRIIGSASFRRLQDKTQVFPLDKNDFIRTRLTHSLEVSSFAKSLGQNVSELIISSNKDKDFSYKEKDSICSILQCAGLIHDIGNPPFGHFGEDSIRDYFKKNLHLKEYDGVKLNKILNNQQIKDFENFEGNTQALRVICKLHFLVDKYGMNLTKALLSTIIKYPVSSLDIKSDLNDIKCKKMGYFYADKDIFEDITESTGTKGNRHPLTFLLEAADDLAYKTADIEDAVKKGFISYSQLLNELKEYDKKRNCCDTYREAIKSLERKYNRAAENNITEKENYAVANWVIYLQSIIIYSASDSFINNYDCIMSGQYKKDLFEGTDAEELMYILGDIAYRYVFSSKEIYKLEIQENIIINFLLDKFVDGLLYFDTGKKLSPIDLRIQSIISEDYKSIYKIYSNNKSEEEKLYLRLMLATDYICGMTDSYAKNLYRELNGI